MKDIFTVFGFTLRENLRKRVFWVITVRVLVVIVAACVILSVLGGGEEQSPGEESPPQEKTDVCYIVDANGLVPGAAETLNQSFGSIGFESADASRMDELKTAVRDDRTKSIVEILPGGEGGLPQLKLYAFNFMTGIPADGIAQVVKGLYVSQVLGAAGVSAENTALALSGISYSMETLGKMEVSGYILGILITMVIFFAVYYYGYGVAMSVAQEKTSRVMETLVVSAKPSRILLGKCLAMGVLGLVQLSAFLIVGALSWSLLIPADFTIGGLPLTLSAFTLPTALLTLTYFLLGYALYALINSVCGATVSRAEDLSAAMMPAILISMVSFYAAYLVMFLPSEGIKRIVTYIPFTAPFIMPYRLLNDTVAAGDIVISLLLLLASIVLVALLSVRIYSASVLRYGQRIRLKDMFKLSS